MKFQKMFRVLFFFTVFVQTAVVKADEWDNFIDAVRPYEGKVTYQQILDQLPLMASPVLLQSSRQPDGSFLMKDADGTIAINPKEVFVSNADQSRQFTFKLIDRAEKEQDIFKAKREGARLQGLRIHLDSTLENKMQDKPFGNLKFSEFAQMVHQHVKGMILKEGGEVSESLRPSSGTPAKVVEFQNQKKDRPHLVVGLWYSADDQDFMVSFCEGFVPREELNTGLRKLAFVHALISGKLNQSVKLAACVSSECSRALQAPLLKEGPIQVVQYEAEGEDPQGKKFFFEKAARVLPVSSCQKYALSQLLSSEGKFYNGIAARNTFPTKIFSNASVISFPNRTSFQHGNTAEQIEKYAQGVVTGILKFLEME